MYHLFSVLENKRRVNNNQEVNNLFGVLLKLASCRFNLTSCKLDLTKIIFFTSD